MSMKKYYERGGVVIYNAMAEDVVPGIKADAILADPPYGINYNTARTHQPRKWFAKAYPAVIGDTERFDPSWLLARSVPLVLWGANYYAHSLPETSSWFIWDKREGKQSDNGADCEMAWTNLGGPARLFRHEWRGLYMGMEQGNVRVHPTQKPVALMKWCISRFQMSASDVVLDPYLGSGTTALAAAQLGRRCVGVEIAERYCEIAARRLDTFFNQPDLFTPPVEAAKSTQLAMEAL